VKNFAVSFVFSLNIQTTNSTLFHNNSSPPSYINKYFNAFSSINHGNMLLCTANKNVDDSFGDATSITISNFKTNKKVAISNPNHQSHSFLHLVK